MKPRTLLILLVALLGLPLAAAAPAAAASKKCKPTAIKLKRAPGATTAKLTWKKPRKAPKRARYRVYKDNAVVGQGGRLSMKVRVSFGKRFRFKVRVLKRNGRPTACSAAKSFSVVYKRATRPAPLAASNQAPGVVRLTWPSSRGGDAQVTGYRVYRDGAVHQKPATNSVDVKVKQGARHVYEVAAIDARGYTSERSQAVTVDYNHKNPPAPAGLSASSVTASAATLSWRPGQHIAGYRVLRDGQPLRQVAGTSTRVENLYASRRYEFSVVAVDTMGYVSAPSAPIAVTTRTPEPSTGSAHAFLLASTDASFVDFQRNYRRIGTVYPTFYDCNTSTAALTGHHDELITQYAKARKVEVLPRFNCQQTAAVHKILTDPATRSRWLNAMVASVEEHGYDGVNVDLEAGAAGDRNAYTSFVAELSSRLHAKGKKVSLAVSAKTWDQPNHPRSTIFDYVQLAQHADYIFVMAWGYRWATSAPGAQDYFPWWKAVADYVATMPNKQRFVMGMQFYAMDWPEDRQPNEQAEVYEYPEALARARAAGVAVQHHAESDGLTFRYQAGGRWRQVWFPDATTQVSRIQLAKAHGLGGVGFWRLGNEDQRAWGNPLLGAGVRWP